VSFIWKDHRSEDGEENLNQIYQTTRKTRNSAFYSKKAISMIDSKEKEFGILYYGGGGSTWGKIWARQVERLDLQHSEMHGIRYWPWKMLGTDTLLENLTIVDYVALLPKSVVGTVPGQIHYGDERVESRNVGSLRAITNWN
jgi:hypothetical protein